MLRNYIKIAFRNLWKSKVFSGVNIAGLALGITAFVLILEYISFEKSYNQFHANLPTLHRVLLKYGGDGPDNDFVPAAMAPALKLNFSEVNAFCRLAFVQNGIVTLESKNTKKGLQAIREANSICVDGDFFEMFSFPIVAGSPSLYAPNTVAISASKAKAYFGAENAVGKVLTLNNQFGKIAYTVVAVFADIPANSDLQFDMVYSMATLITAAKESHNDWARLDRWEGAFSQAIVQLDPQANPAVFEKQASKLVQTYRPKTNDRIRLQPLAYLHLGASLSDERPTVEKLGFIYLLGGIALLILTIAWLNYVNLSTAGALKRAKEVGVRKVVGANRAQIAMQFLSESLLLNLLGFALAAVLIGVLQAPFNELIGKDLSFDVIAQGQVWVLALVAVVIGALASGGYAAFVLSGFPVLSIIKGIVSKGRKPGLTATSSVRQTLVVVQFAISIVLIIATVVLYRQLSFMQNRNLGMNLEQLLVIKGAEVGDDATRQAGKVAFRNEIAQLPYVSSFCNSGSVPGGWYNFNSDGVTRMNPNPGDEKKNYAVTYADNRFIPTYGIKLAAGENFTAEMCDKATEAGRVLLNERAVKSLGFSSAQAAVGQKIKFNTEFEIVGVITDYHHQSLQQSIEPLLIFPAYPGSNYTLRLNTNEIQTKIAGLEQRYKRLFPGNPFEYYFVSENYNKQYQTEQKYGRIFTTAAGLAIFIACLGLFGLATFTAEQRTKEIGVRKVLGASAGSIVALLSRDFLKLVVIAIIIATPLAWYAMNRWLQDFAYRVELSWWMFVLAGGIAMLIALATVSFQSLKAALVNPVKSLKSE
ncbi:ABC transporter permease [Tellurirhabdus bombi]|uniref:ABC transporter permease n=1 Tax=Tellurirhabdus bombi TaxID=2907205 RepID=UPI001F2C416A|nr:ABC transporter permease [Tellurirhabdus bombi]